jgi:hypothetical protein
MGMLGREGLLVKEELTIEKVDLDKGDFVYVRQMTGRERDRFDQSLMEEKTDRSGRKTYERNLSDFRAKLAVNTLCDEDGKNLLNPQDIATLSQNMSAARLEKIMNKAQELNKITEEDKENLVKNSEGDQVADSTSDSA